MVTAAVMDIVAVAMAVYFAVFMLRIVGTTAIETYAALVKTWRHRNDEPVDDI